MTSAGICTVEHWTQAASGISAFIAAVIWWRASRTKTPAVLTYGAMNDLTAGIIKQSRLNARAAFFACIAAILQVPVSLMPTCWSAAPWFLSN